MRDTQCDEQRLAQMLDDLLDQQEAEQVIDHLNHCLHCQSKAAALTASEAEWNQVKNALKHRGDLPSTSIPSLEHPSVDRSEAWVDSMVKQLLSPPQHPEMLGRLGRYEVERLIGIGGMGIVFKAFDTELNRPVAIKVLAPSLAGHGAARQRFSREAKAAAAIVHHHVVSIHNVETDREIPFIVMHLVAGESLQQRIDREGSLKIEEILRIGTQVASGLAAAHQQGLVHRDIKPSNILLEETSVERALITDFGLARAADDAQMTCTGSLMGTPQYMSPEQAQGDAVDYASDLFSLGSVLYTTCTGRAPFHGSTPLSILRKIRDEEPENIRQINPDIPVWLCRVIGTLMSKNKKARYASANQAHAILETCLAHVQQPTTVPLPAELVSSENTYPYRWMGAITLATLAIVTLFIASGFWGPHSDDLKSLEAAAKNESSVAGQRVDSEAKEQVPQPIDTPTGNLVLGHGYTRQGDSLFLEGRRIDDASLRTDHHFQRRGLTPAESVDTASFQVLSKQFSKDKHFVYYTWVHHKSIGLYQIDTADPMSFEVMGDSLARDSEQVWSHYKVVPDCDPSSLKVVKEGIAWKDAHNAWYGSYKIEGVKSRSFKHLANEYYRDSKRVYWCGGPLHLADPKTFQTFREDLPYGRDHQNVWHRDKQLHDVDADTFQVVQHFIYKDKNGVYAHHLPIPNVKADSFRQLAEIYGYMNGLFTDGEKDFVSLSKYGGFHEVKLEGDSLRVFSSIVDWNLQTPEIAEITSALLTPNGWEEINVSEKFEARLRGVLKVWRPNFEMAQEILKNRQSSK